MMTQTRLRLFVDGQFVEAGDRKVFPDINPATGEVVAEVSEAGSREVDAAVASAKKARSGPWGKMTLAERLELLRKTADRMNARFEEFLRAEILDTGKPVSWARAIDIPRGAANFKVFADLARGVSSEVFETRTPEDHALNYTLRVPVGVVGVICPWNLPLLLLTWKVAPALACGNTVVVKPSRETPATATLLGEIMNEAGIPPGVYNVVHGAGSTTGDLLVRHPDIAAITFTGESGTGQEIMRAAAPRIKRLSFELGGKNPAVIFADADFEKAVAGTARSVFANTGQVCLCTERVYVERPLFEKFVEALKKRAEAYRLGDPFSPETTLGPLISAAHREKVLSYYHLAVSEGATVVTGGGIPDLGTPYERGAFVEPTLWVGLPETARVVREEIFGPVCHVQPFDDEEEAVSMANDSPYGLAATVWTQNLDRAHRVSEKLEAGLTWVNCWFLRDLRTPFGGMKQSGMGREGGEHSLNFYSEIRNVCVKIT